MARLWTISSAAMAAFEQAARERFQRQMLARLSCDFSDRARELGEEGMKGAIERGIHFALGYGIITERDIEGFLKLYFQAEFAPEERWPWAAAILANGKLDGSAKTEFMQQMLQ